VEIREVMRSWAAVVALACLVWPAYADAFLPAMYAARDIRATVVDAESGAPIEGASSWRYGNWR
jgi:hypothetical protein